MPTLPKVPPSSLRPTKLPPVLRTPSASENRPYLVSTLRRREIFSDGMRTLITDRSLTLFAHESEDARLTGSTRSLFRRLLALNLPNSAVAEVTAPRPVPEVVVGKPVASVTVEKFPVRSVSA
ncbi:MAG TPA: hypothetical protein VIM60_00145 [Edaphobacter sp.]